MTLFQILSLCGVPSFMVIAFTWLYKRIKQNNEETNAVKMGVQALLRAQMVSDYNRWSERGYAPIYARENFENCWEQYHRLNGNGFVTDLHDKFMELPTKKPKYSEQ